MKIIKYILRVPFYLACISFVIMYYLDDWFTNFMRWVWDMDRKENM